jgi:predicted transcriptional regulator
MVDVADHGEKNAAVDASRRIVASRRVEPAAGSSQLPGRRRRPSPTPAPRPTPVVTAGRVRTPRWFAVGGGFWVGNRRPRFKSVRREGVGVPEDVEVTTVVGLLDDDYARDILAVASERKCSAKELAEAVDASLPTVYRRVDDLVDAGLLVEETELRSDGNHHSVYVTTLSRVELELSEGTFEMQLERKTDVADRFTDMFERL